MSLLSRILNNNAPRKWLSLHPNATIQQQSGTPDGYAVTYHDQRSGQWATYTTDRNGNVLKVDVIP